LRYIDRLRTVPFGDIATIHGRTEQPACRHDHRHEEQDALDFHAMAAGFTITFDRLRAALVD